MGIRKRRACGDRYSRFAGGEIYGDCARLARDRGFGHPFPDGLDMKNGAIRILGLALSLGVERARVVGHDIGLMVAYAYAAQFPGETEKTRGDGCVPARRRRLGGCLQPPGVSGEPALMDRRLRLWWGRERIYFDYFWNDFAADKTRSLPEADRAACGGVCASRTNAGRVGVLRFFPAGGKRFCGVVEDQADHAGFGDRWREGKRHGARGEQMKIVAADSRMIVTLKGPGALGAGGAAKTDDRRAAEVFVRKRSLWAA